MRYAVIVEKGSNSVGAYAPDLPGCGVVGETREEALRLIREAIVFHLEGLREGGRADSATGLDDRVCAGLTARAVVSSQGSVVVNASAIFVFTDD